MNLRCNIIRSLTLCVDFDVVSDTFHRFFVGKGIVLMDKSIQIIDFIVKVIVSQIVVLIRCEIHLSFT